MVFASGTQFHFYFSVIVQHKTSRRFVWSSSAESGDVRSWRWWGVQRTSRAGGKAPSSWIIDNHRRVCFWSLPQTVSTFFYLVLLDYFCPSYGSADCDINLHMIENGIYPIKIQLKQRRLKPTLWLRNSKYFLSTCLFSLRWIKVFSDLHILINCF